MSVLCDNRDLSNAPKKVAEDCAEAYPTAALAKKPSPLNRMSSQTSVNRPTLLFLTPLPSRTPIYSET